MFHNISCTTVKGFSALTINRKMSSLDLAKIVHQIVTFSDEKVIDFTMPEELEQELTKKLERVHSSHHEVEEIVELVLSKCVNTTHPYFLNQLYAGVHPTGLISTFIAEKMNTNAHTYEVAPVFVLAERIILKEMRKLFFGMSEGDGVFCPGGSMANMYAMILARQKHFPETKSKGIFHLPPLVVFTSADAHYSISKAANWLGFGLDNVVKVPTNKNGAMITSELQNLIRKVRSEGKYPLMVNSTAGTTVLGAFDDFEEIAKVCQAENIWNHCDAAWGGAFIFSPDLRQKWLRGVEKCDSIAWNAHKMLGAPLQCSVFITKQPDFLNECNSLIASYLFQQDKFYSVEYDRGGDKSFQCGRKSDAFKLWFMWACLGLQGFRELVENTENCARYITEQLKQRKEFLLYLDEHQCTNVFFWYIPPRLQNKEKIESWWQELGDIATKIKEKMVLDGKMMIGYSPLPHKNVPNAIRLVITSYPPKTIADMDEVLNHIVQLGKDL